MEVTQPVAQITSVNCSGVIDLIGSSLMMDTEMPSETTVSSQVIFSSKFTPVSVSEDTEDELLTYSVNFSEDIPVGVTKLWYINIQGECAETVDYVTVTLEEPLEQGKRGGQVVVIRQLPG